MRRILFLLLPAVWASAGCQKKPVSGSPGGGGFATQIVVVEAKRQPVSETLSLVGTLAANEMVELKCEAEGTVEEILFQEGQPVKRGDLLLRLDESKFASAAAEAEANFKLSQANHDRSKELLRDKLISPQEFDQVSALFQANQAGLDLKKRLWKDSRIFAPFDGIISSRNVSPGQVISRNTTFSWLVDLDPVKVEVGVPERFLSQLALGQNIDITVATYAGRKFTGKVFFIAPFVDPAFRTALVKAKIPNPKQELKPGMFANLDLTLKIRDNSVVIPEPALVQLLEGQRAQIYTVSASNTAQSVTVQLGVRLPGQVEVLSGLSGGEKVIVEGTQKIGPGVKVKFAPPEAAAPYLGNEVGKGVSESVGR
jgi:membrane fusion protein (multidrug efflux system)